MLLHPVSIMEGRWPLMKFVHVLTGKLVAFALVSVAIVGGATAVFAATPVSYRNQNLQILISSQPSLHLLSWSKYYNVNRCIQMHLFYSIARKKGFARGLLICDV